MPPEDGNVDKIEKQGDKAFESVVTWCWAYLFLWIIIVDILKL